MNLARLQTEPDTYIAERRDKLTSRINYLREQLNKHRPPAPQPPTVTAPHTPNELRTTPTPDEPLMQTSTSSLHHRRHCTHMER